MVFLPGGTSRGWTTFLPPSVCFLQGSFLACGAPSSYQDDQAATACPGKTPHDSN
jgi:hypothetical protein